MIDVIPTFHGTVSECPLLPHVAGGTQRFHTSTRYVHSINLSIYPSSNMVVYHIGIYFEVIICRMSVRVDSYAIRKRKKLEASMARSHRPWCHHTRNRQLSRKTVGTGTAHYTARCTLKLAHCTLHTATCHCTLHAVPCTQHLAHCTFNTAPCTLHSAPCTLHPAHCTLHTAPGTLHLAHCILRNEPGKLHHANCTMHTAPCKLHLVNCTLHTDPCMLHIAHRTLHTPPCILQTAPSQRGQARRERLRCRTASLPLS